jgi:putative SOS response-associated peptidase YedK
LDWLVYGMCGENRMAVKWESFTIITTEPNELVRPVHNRMPVILPPKTKSNGLTLLEHLSLSQITVEALSRRADGCA